MSRIAREFCEIDPEGRRDDARLHTHILDGAGVSAQDAVILRTRERLIAAGEDPELMRRLYPISTDA